MSPTFFWAVLGASLALGIWSYFHSKKANRGPQLPPVDVPQLPADFGKDLDEEDSQYHPEKVVVRAR